MKESERPHPDGFCGQAKPPVDHWVVTAKKE
jgi:hypothetical protein